MNKTLQKAKEEFKEFFDENFHFECEDGWSDLIFRLCSEIRKIKDYPEPLQVLQVKEKFGGLRFYISSGSRKIHDLINEAEDQSFTICEFCGSTENVKTDGSWLKTLCQKCREIK